MIAMYQIAVLRADGGNVYRRNKGESWKTRARNRVRDVLRMQDEPLRVSLSTLGREGAELVPDPPEPLRLDRARPDYFLVLSNSCSTCQVIGSGLAAPASRLESAITVLVASDSERHGQEWAASVGLDTPGSSPGLTAVIGGRCGQPHD